VSAGLTRLIRSLVLMTLIKNLGHHKSGLEHHMITKLEDGLKSCSLVIFVIFLWCILSLCLMWVGINLYFINNQVLIKFAQLKC
jgi:hypothetical protein